MKYKDKTNRHNYFPPFIQNENILQLCQIYWRRGLGGGGGQLERGRLKVKTKGKGVKSAYKPSGSSGQIVFQFQHHEETRSISTHPWMGC